MTLALGIVQEWMNVLLSSLRVLHSTCKYIVMSAKKIRNDAELTEIYHILLMTLALGIVQAGMNVLLLLTKILYSKCK